MELESPVRLSMTRRALAKQRTRRRLIAEAKQLASERGYEAATLRDIAARAELSTGAVFASFADKADLFRATILDDDEALLAVMKRAAEAASAPRQALTAMLSAAQTAQAAELSWVRVKMSLIWSEGFSGDSRAIGTALADVVRDGVRAGKLSPKADPQMIAEMAWDAYLGALRHGVIDGWPAERVNARLAASIDVLLDGFELRAWDMPGPQGLSRPANAPSTGSFVRALRG